MYLIQPLLLNSHDTLTFFRWTPRALPTALGPWENISIVSSSLFPSNANILPSHFITLNHFSIILVVLYIVSIRKAYLQAMINHLPKGNQILCYIWNIKYTSSMVGTFLDLFRMNVHIAAINYKIDVFLYFSQHGHHLGLYLHKLTSTSTIIMVEGFFGTIFFLAKRSVNTFILLL